MSQSTQNTPTQPQLCKMGCGFFGSNATGDCCSKCWKDLQARQKKNEGEVGTAASVAETAAAPMETAAVPAEPETAPMEVETPVKAPASPAAAEKKTPSPAAATPIKKKKKKKGGYKNMMAAMLEGNQTRDSEKEKETLRGAVGGGTFSKIDKI